MHRHPRPLTEHFSKMSSISVGNEANKKPRHIRSFVRREGRLTAAQKNALDMLWSHYGITYLGHNIDFDNAFGRKAERIMEIGFGNGEALLALTQQYPEKDFIGIEVHRPGVGQLLSALEQRRMTNVRLFCHDAIDILQNGIPDNSLNAVHLFFPDPWPKKRHHKRRIVQPPFVDTLYRLLCAGGLFYIATDWTDYAEHIRQVLASYSGFKPVDSSAPRLSLMQRPATKFERRGRKLNHPIHDLIYQKSGT